jgi:hypothetical protein
MAMTINSTLHLQPTDEAALDAEGAETLTLEWKGTYAACRATADTIEPGVEIPTVAQGNAYTPDSSLYAGYHAVSWTVRRGNGDTAVLYVACRKADAVDSSQQGGDSTTPFRDVISLKSVRNDVSILAYCGSSSSQPNRAAIERWMREPNPKLAAAFKYTDENGTTVDMNDEPLLKSSIPLVRKIMAGTERVIRFYPQITRRRSYYAPPIDLFQDLSYIDTPPSPSSNTLGPNGLSTLIAAHQWLKVQDDCDEQQDRTWMRTESWIGIATADSSDGSPWDPDLYGPSRWKMPKEDDGS